MRLCRARSRTECEEFGSPPRTELTLEPGSTRMLNVYFRNATGTSTKMRFYTRDVQGNPNPDNFLQLVERARFRGTYMA